MRAAEGGEMGFYGRYVVPRIIDRVMRDAQVSERRATLIPAATGRVLEIGVGSGLNIPLYGKAVESLEGIEPSHHLLSREQAATAPFPVSLTDASAEVLPFEADQFDTVVSTWTLCTIPDAAIALSEIRRVLKPAGRFLFIEHGRAETRGVRRAQNLINPAWRVVSGGCNINRPIAGLISGAGFAIPDLRTDYMPGPRPMTFTYQGSAQLDSG
jgi:ubiquinone/menaquinone biosynthesis C-methylase UbiE